MAKYKDGRKYIRRLGARRKFNSIYDNLGHPYDIESKEVIFIGNEEKTYCLTKNKAYTIIKSVDGKHCFDHTFKKEGMQMNDYESSQGEDYLIVIMNDKGHKRKYVHNMFKMQ